MDKVMVNIWNGHFKVWCCDIEQDQAKYIITSHWGHVGKPKSGLQKTTKTFYSYYSAIAFQEQKMSEKRMKGYESFPATRYWELIQTGQHSRLPLEINQHAFPSTVSATANVYAPIIPVVKQIPKQEPPKQQPPPPIRRAINIRKEAPSV